MYGYLRIAYLYAGKDRLKLISQTRLPIANFLSPNNFMCVLNFNCNFKTILVVRYLITIKIRVF